MIGHDSNGIMSRISMFTMALVVAFAMAACVLHVQSAAAAVTSPTLFMAQGNNFASDLYTIDPATGAATSVGNIGMAVTGMAYNTTTGTLYGVTTPNSLVSPRNLITIDTNTGAPTVIGPLVSGSGTETIAELEFDGSGTLWGWSESGDHLASIDLGTGAVTEFPNFISTAGDGMIWIPSSDTLWFMPNSANGNYYTLNRTTGEPTSVGTLSGAGSQTIPAAAISCDGLTSHATLMGNPTNLATVDFATGVVTDIGSTGVNTGDALAWACVSVAPPPTPPTPPAPTPAALPPVLSAVGHLPVRRCTPATGRCRVGIKFTLDQAATVTLKITRQYGRKTLRRCSTVNPEIRNKPVCTLNRPTYTKTISGRVGANNYTFKFPRTATLGHYTFTLRATNSNGSSLTRKSRFILPWG